MSDIFAPLSLPSIVNPSYMTPVIAPPLPPPIIFSTDPGVASQQFSASIIANNAATNAYNVASTNAGIQTVQNGITAMQQQSAQMQAQTDHLAAQERALTNMAVANMTSPGVVNSDPSPVGIDPGAATGAPADAPPVTPETSVPVTPLAPTTDLLSQNLAPPPDFSLGPVDLGTITPTPPIVVTADTSLLPPPTPVLPEPAPLVLDLTPPPPAVGPFASLDTPAVTPVATDVPPPDISAPLVMDLPQGTPTTINTPEVIQAINDAGPSVGPNLAVPDVLASGPATVDLPPDPNFQVALVPDITSSLNQVDTGLGTTGAFTDPVTGEVKPLDLGIQPSDTVVASTDTLTNVVPDTTVTGLGPDPGFQVALVPPVTDGLTAPEPAFQVVQNSPDFTGEPDPNAIPMQMFATDTGAPPTVPAPLTVDLANAGGDTQLGDSTQTDQTIAQLGDGVIPAATPGGDVQPSDTVVASTDTPDSVVPDTTVTGLGPDPGFQVALVPPVTDGLTAPQDGTVSTAFTDPVTGEPAPIDTGVGPDGTPSVALVQHDDSGTNAFGPPPADPLVVALADPQTNDNIAQELGLPPSTLDAFTRTDSPNGSSVSFTDNSGTVMAYKTPDAMGADTTLYPPDDSNATPGLIAQLGDVVREPDLPNSYTAGNTWAQLIQDVQDGKPVFDDQSRQVILDASGNPTTAEQLAAVAGTTADQSSGTTNDGSTVSTTSIASNLGLPSDLQFQLPGPTDSNFQLGATDVTGSATSGGIIVNLDQVAQTGGVAPDITLANSQPPVPPLSDGTDQSQVIADITVPNTDPQPVGTLKPPSAISFLGNTLASTAAALQDGGFRKALGSSGNNGTYLGAQVLAAGAQQALSQLTGVPTDSSMWKGFFDISKPFSLSQHAGLAANGLATFIGNGGNPTAFRGVAIIAAVKDAAAIANAIATGDAPPEVYQALAAGGDPPPISYNGTSDTSQYPAWSAGTSPFVQALLAKDPVDSSTSASLALGGAVGSKINGNPGALMGSLAYPLVTNTIAAVSQLQNDGKPVTLGNIASKLSDFYFGLPAAAQTNTPTPDTNIGSFPVGGLPTLDQIPPYFTSNLQH